jgi:hypothetical protein
MLMNIQKKKNTNFTMIENEILWSKNVSLQARAIYSIIKSYCQKPKFGGGHEWKVTQKELSKIAGISESTLQKYLKEIKSIGLIQTRAANDPGVPPIYQKTIYSIVPLDANIKKILK